MTQTLVSSVKTIPWQMQNPVHIWYFLWLFCTCALQVFSQHQSKEPITSDFTVIVMVEPQWQSVSWRIVNPSALCILRSLPPIVMPAMVLFSYLRSVIKFLHNFGRTPGFMMIQQVTPVSVVSDFPLVNVWILYPVQYAIWYNYFMELNWSCVKDLRILKCKLYVLLQESNHTCVLFQFLSFIFIYFFIHL